MLETLREPKGDLDWHSNLGYFGSCAVLMACYMDFMLWFVPSFDEIGERKAELERLEAQITQKSKALKILIYHGTMVKHALKWI